MPRPLRRALAQVPATLPATLPTTLPAAILAAVLVGALLGGCASTRETASAALGANFGSGTDTSGTQRRPDVNYNFTRPTVPSIANR